MGRPPDRRAGGRSLQRTSHKTTRAPLPRQRHEGPADPGCRQEGTFSADRRHVLADQRRETPRLGARSRFARPAPAHRPRVSWRPAAALLALGCAFSLLAPGHSSASSLVVPREAHARSPRSNYARHDEVPPRLTGAERSRSDAPPPAERASLPVLLILALNSAVMLIRLVSSPPNWIKDQGPVRGGSERRDHLVHAQRRDPPARGRPAPSDFLATRTYTEELAGSHSGPRRARHEATNARVDGAAMGRS
jgi:hypothetical protein